MRNKILKELRTNPAVKRAEVGILTKIAKKFKTNPKNVGALYRVVRLEEMSNNHRRSK